MNETIKQIPAAGGIVLNEKGEILILFRRSKWDLPKGHVEKGETFEEAALREVKEETGLKKLVIVKFISITRHEYYDHALKMDVIKETRWFEIQGTKEEFLEGQAEEGIEWVRWVTKEDLPVYMLNSYPNIIDIFQQAGLLEG